VSNKQPTWIFLCRAHLKERATLNNLALPQYKRTPQPTAIQVLRSFLKKIARALKKSYPQPVFKKTGTNPIYSISSLKYLILNANCGRRGQRLAGGVNSS